VFFRERDEKEGLWVQVFVGIMLLPLAALVLLVWVLTIDESW
jgi:hypothetical protein